MPYFHGVNVGLVWFCGGGLEEVLEDIYDIQNFCSWLLE
jgi:hypothetical protein